MMETFKRTHKNLRKLFKISEISENLAKISEFALEFSKIFSILEPAQNDIPHIIQKQ